jgi:predicted nucleic acid-binding protein
MEKGWSTLMMEAVVDASVVASWFLPDEKGGVYDALLDIIDRIKLHVPPIFVYEFFNILLVAEKRGRLSPEFHAKILHAVEKLPIFVESLFPDIRKNDEILTTARIYNLTPYDAAYFELAARLGQLPLLTYDKQMLEAARKFKITTHL